MTSAERRAPPHARDIRKSPHGFCLRYRPFSVGFSILSKFFFFFFCIGPCVKEIYAFNNFFCMRFFIDTFQNI